MLKALAANGIRQPNVRPTSRRHSLRVRWRSVSCPLVLLKPGRSEIYCRITKETEPHSPVSPETYASAMYCATRSPTSVVE
jgi:hypothetical protein